jgi:hypothetical protein
MRSLFGVSVAQSVWTLATVWTAVGWEFESRQDQKCTPLHVGQADAEAYPASYPMGTGEFSPGVKRQGSEAVHPPQYSAEFKNEGSIPPLLHTSLLRRA